MMISQRLIDSSQALMKEADVLEQVNRKFEVADRGIAEVREGLA